MPLDVGIIIWALFSTLVWAGYSVQSAGEDPNRRLFYRNISIMMTGISFVILFFVCFCFPCDEIKLKLKPGEYECAKMERYVIYAAHYQNQDYIKKVYDGKAMSHPEESTVQITSDYNGFHWILYRDLEVIP